MIVVITGGSSGIGLETGMYLVKHGCIVYSLSRHPMDDQGNFHFLTCDVTNLNSINEALSLIIKKEKKIDVLINNAGMGISGPIEEASEEKIKKIIDVNLLGTIYTTKVFLPELRKTHGKIINIGSIAGEFPIAFQSLYSVTKSGIEMFSESLQVEVKPFGVKVTCVMPGDTKTNFTSNREKEENDSIYKERVKKSISKMEKDEQNGDSPLKVAKVIYKCIKKKNPPLKVSVDFKYKLLLILKRILPTRIVNNILYSLYGK